jgi:U2 small nuclear ribonucleoprotein A'
MRLTLELLQQAGQSISPSKHRQLTLRGFKIPAIENLGTTQDEYEAIDLGDNDIIKIANIPPLRRLKVLILVNNRITRIAEDVFAGLPNLTSLVLTNNKLEKMVDIEPIFKSTSLQRLALLENPLTKIKHYRPFLIHKCSESLRILDFNRIKDKDRKAATALFAGERGEKLLSEVAPARGAQQDTAAATANAPSSEVIEKIKKAIAEATTIEEVTRLEKALKSGVLPDDMIDSKDEKEEDVDGEPVQASPKAPPAKPAPAGEKRAAPKAASEPAKKKVMTKEFDSASGKMVDVEMEVEVDDAKKPAEAAKEEKPKEEAKTEAPAEEKKAEEKVTVPGENALKKMKKDELVEMAKKLEVTATGTKDDLIKAIRSKA